jgi:hypothetical protein
MPSIEAAPNIACRTGSNKHWTQIQQALKNWTALIPSRKKEILRHFSQLKSLDARTRNLSKALHVLSGEAERFMARNWRNGS